MIKTCNVCDMQMMEESVDYGLDCLPYCNDCWVDHIAANISCDRCWVEERDC